MADWHYAQKDRSEELAHLHMFSMIKKYSAGEIEFTITVREYITRNAHSMRFFAQADKEVNQKTAAFRPFGWGESLLQALSECMESIRKNRYEPEGETADGAQTAGQV